jgi:hypothetical protein
LLLFFQHLDDVRDSGPEELQVSSTDLLLETSEIVSLIITSTFSAVIVKLSNFGDAYFNIKHSTELQVEEVCCDLNGTQWQFDSKFGTLYYPPS